MRHTLDMQEQACEAYLRYAGAVICGHIISRGNSRRSTVHVFSVSTELQQRCNRGGAQCMCFQYSRAATVRRSPVLRLLLHLLNMSLLNSCSSVAALLQLCCSAMLLLNMSLLNSASYIKKTSYIQQQHATSTNVLVALYRCPHTAIYVSL